MAYREYKERKRAVEIETQNRGTQTPSETHAPPPRRSKIALTLVLILCTAVPARSDEADDYVEARMRSLHIPGASLAVVRDGQIVKAQGYGIADLELNAPATKATVYEIGSNTKQFTAAAVMMLVEEGKVGLDDAITKYFPEAPETWGRITVRHRAGAEEAAGENGP